MAVPPHCPFAREASAAISALGETALLGKIRQWLTGVTPPIPEGMGDDAAVLPGTTAPANLFTTDSLIYGRHFDASTPPQAVGAKLLKRSLSDIAAMAGRPHSAVLACLLPKQVSTAWLSACYAGLRDEALRYRVAIVGGDLAETEADLAFSLSLLGRAERPVGRSGAQVGDRLYLTGELGGSLAGKDLDFEPRLAEGHWLGQQAGVRAMIDVTDGLSKELPLLLPPDCAAGLCRSALPVSAAARACASRSGRSPLDHALSDGEDYELLFTLSPEVDAQRFLHEWQTNFSTPLREIGQVLPRPASNVAQIVDLATGVALLAQPGFEHFC